MTVGTGDSGSGIVSGTPKKADNTGRDWGQGLEIGAATAGSIISSILSFGAAAAPSVAATAALAGTTAAIDVAQDNAQNAEQGRQLQKQLDAKQAAQPSGPDTRFATPLVQMGNPNGNPNFQSGKIGSGQNLRAAAQPMGVISTGGIGGGGNNFSGFVPKPNVEQAPVAQTDTVGTSFDGTSPNAVGSDRRIKTNIASGNAAVDDFLSKVRARGAWPKGLKNG